MCVHESVSIRIIRELLMFFRRTRCKKPPQKNDKANAVIWITQSACKEHTHSDDKDSIVGRKVKTVVTIYTLIPSLGALGDVNLGPHYEMYLNLTKN